MRYRGKKHLKKKRKEAYLKREDSMRKKYGKEGIKETEQAEDPSSQMPYPSMFQRPGVTGTNVTVML